MKALLAKIRAILRDRKARRFWARVISVLASVVVFISTYALILPAITMETVAACGIEAHQHSDDCYEEVLVCGMEESEDHQHTDSCYERVLICGKEAHIHSAECYKEDSTAVAATGGTSVPVIQAGGQSGSPDQADYRDDFQSGFETGFETDSGGTEISGGLDGSGSGNSDGSGALDVSDGSLETSGQDAGSAEAVDEGNSTAAGVDGSSGSGEASGTWATSALTVNENAADGTTNVLPADLAEEELAGGYVPELDALNFDALLTKETGFYYFHPEESQSVPENSSDITDWKELKKDTTLASTDLVKAYLAYSIPAGALNETNQVARYRLPANIHLTDDQILAINSTENGIAASYVIPGTQTTDDPDNYRKYLGAEAVEGTRTPDKTLREGAMEYVSAVVKAENVYENTLDENGSYVDAAGHPAPDQGEYIGQDLIFIFTPYTIQKNQNTYDNNGNPIRAGEKVTGWFAVDFNMDQIDWIEQDTDLDNSTIEKSAEVVFAAPDQDAGTKEVSRTLRMLDHRDAADQTEAADAEAASDGRTADGDVSGEGAEDASEQANDDLDEEGENADIAGTEESAEKSVEEEGAEKDTDKEDSLTEKNKEAEEDKDKKDAEEGKPAYSSGTLEASGSDYTITLNYTAEAEIPADAELSVHEITAESNPEAYEACLEEAGRQVAPGENETVDAAASRFFDIEIVAPARRNEETAENTMVTDTAEAEAVTGEAAVDAPGQAAEDEKNTVEGENEEAVQEATEGAGAADEAETTAESVEPVRSDSDSPAEMVKIEPKAPVSVNIQFNRNIASGSDSSAEKAGKSASPATDAATVSEPTVLHFAEEGVETIDAATGTANDPVSDNNQQVTGAEDDRANAEKQDIPATSVQFEANSFSIYGVVYKSVITDTFITASGETYEITVTYDDDAQIPAGSELKVREVTAEDEEYADLYQEAAQRASEDAADQGFDMPVVTAARLFDIEIHNKKTDGGEDRKIEPAAPVQVSIRLKNTEKAEKMSVVHFAESGTEIMALKSANQEAADGTNSTKDEQTGEDYTEFSFDTESFSVYSVVNVTNLNDLLNDNQYALVSQRGPGIGSANDGNPESVSNYAMISAMNGSTLSGKGVHLSGNIVGGDVTKWGFESAGGNQYYIYMMDGTTKKYVRTNGNNLELTTQQNNAGKFTVTVTDNKVRFGINNGYITNTGDNPSRFVIEYRPNNDTLFTLAKLDPNYEEKTAKKVSAQDWKDSSAGTGKWDENSTVLIYRRIEHADGSEDLYILATDGSLIPAYDGGDSIFYHCPVDKNVNWHVALGAGTSGYYISNVVPDGSEESTVYLAPSVTNGTWKSDSPVGLTLNGLGNEGSYGTRIQVWDQDAYVYAGLHVDASSAAAIKNGIVPGSEATDDTFLFAVSDTLISEGQLHTVDTVDSTSLGITMKIFNYGGDTYNWSYRNAAMQAVMGDDMLSDWSNRKSHVTKTVSSKLGDDGFPVSLSNRNSYKPLFTNGETISYEGRKQWDLTATGYEAGSITVEGHNANNLFLQSYYDESQTFRYSSLENFAHFNTSGEDAGKFSVYRETGTPNIPTQNDHYYYYHGHFMPYNNLDPTVSVSRIVDQYGSLADKEEGRSYENVYGLRETPDYYVGMSMEAKFVQPSDGKLENGDPVVYRFTGDDDLLVYIDGILVLDVGGIHEPLTGSINFETGTVIQPNFYGQGDAWGHTETTLYNIFYTAYKNNLLSPDEWSKLKWKDVDGDGTPDTFDDYTTHSFKMFYMERGAGASNLDLQFNLKVVKKDEFVVRKQLPEGIDNRFVNQVFKYQATYIDTTEPVEANRVKPLRKGAKNHAGSDVCLSVTYKDLKDPDTGEPITKEVEVDEYGYFYLKAGEAAVFKMASDDIEYDVNVKETMIDTNLIQQIDINNEQNVSITPDTGTPGNGNVAEAGFEKVGDRGEVIYTNHPYTRNLNITKHLTSDSAPLEPGELPVFEFRVYLERTVTETTGTPPMTQDVHKLYPYSYGPYYVTKEINGVTHYYKLNGLNNAPVDQGTEPVICSTTGRSGSINSIPPEYTIVIPDLAVGTNFYLEERLDEKSMPKGYEFVEEKLKPGTYGPETLTNESLESTAVIKRILARDETDHQQFDPSTIGAIIKDHDAESHVYNRKKSIDLPIEKIWSPSVPGTGTDINLALVRFKAPVPAEPYVPPTDKGAIQINHVAKYGDTSGASLPNEFVAKYEIKNSEGDTVIPETLSKGPFDLDPGTYTVIAHIVRSADPEDYAYVKTESVEVTVAADQTVSANLVSEYKKEKSGFIDISHVASGLTGTELPQGFTATYSIQNAAGQYAHTDIPAGKYAVAPGTYTVKVNVSDPAAPTGYTHQSTTESVTVTVASEETKDAEFTSTYVQNGIIKIVNTAQGLPDNSTVLPSGFKATYTISASNGTTTITGAEAGREYSVAPGEYTVTAHVTDSAAPSSYSYVTTAPVNVTVSSGNTPAQADLVSEYIVTPEDGYIIVREKFVDASSGTEITRPNGFSAGFNITGNTPGLSSYANISAEESKYVLPGEYTVTANMWTQPSGELAYVGADPVTVSVTGGTSEVTVTHKFGSKGTLTVVPKSTGLPGNTTDMPDSFSANYKITNVATGDTVNGGQAQAGTAYTVAPGTYTIELVTPVGYEGNLTGEYKYYSRSKTEIKTVEVPSGGNVTAEIVSTYTYTAPETKKYTVTVSSWKDKYDLAMESGPDEGSITIPIHGNESSVFKTVTLSPTNNWTAEVELPVGEGSNGNYYINPQWDMTLSTEIESVTPINATCSHAQDGTFTVEAKWKGSSANDITYTLSGTWKDLFGNTLTSEQLPDSGSVTVKIIDNHYNDTGKSFVLSPPDWTSTVNLPYGEGHGEYKIVNDNQNVSISGTSVKIDSFTTSSGTDTSDKNLEYIAVANESPYITTATFTGFTGQIASFKYDSESVVPDWFNVNNNGTEIPVPLKANNTAVNSYSITFGYLSEPKQCTVIANGRVVKRETKEPGNGQVLTFSVTEGPIEIIIGNAQTSNTVLPGTLTTKHAFRSVAPDVNVLDPYRSSTLPLSEAQGVNAVGDTNLPDNPVQDDLEAPPVSGAPTSNNGLTDINPMSVTIPQDILNGLPANGGYTLDVSFGKSIALNGGEQPDAWKKVISNLAEYDIYGTPYYYAIVEVPVPDTYTVSYNNNPVSAQTIRNNMDARAAAQAAGNDGPSLITMQAINTRDTVPGSLLVQKKVDGLTDTTNSFTFEISFSSSGSVDGTYTAVKTKADGSTDSSVTSLTFTNGKATVSLKANEKIEITNLPEGIVYSVTETGTLPTGYSQGTHENTSGTIAQDTTATVTMNNIYSVGLDIIKVDETDGSKKIPGAQFTIQKIKQTFTANDVEYDGAESDPITTNGQGEAQFTGITKGYYEIHESKIPDGYVSTSDGCFYIKVDEGQIKLLDKDLSIKDLSNWVATKTVVGNVSLTAKTATVKNTPGAALPNSGGPGTKHFYILGALMTALAGVWYVMRRRRV